MIDEYENRQYVIFNVSELYKIDFTKVFETSSDTVRLSVDGTKTFVKWYGEEPECISSLMTIQDRYTYSEIINILSTKEWSEINL